jgi:methylglyoxal synthase
MNEVESMSSGDSGGAVDLIASIKISKIHIVSFILTVLSRN